MAALHALGLAEAVSLVRTQEVSPVAMVEDCLKRIDA